MVHTARINICLVFVKIMLNNNQTKEFQSQKNSQYPFGRTWGWIKTSIFIIGKICSVFVQTKISKINFKYGYSFTNKISYYICGWNFIC